MRFISIVALSLAVYGCSVTQPDPKTGEPSTPTAETEARPRVEAAAEDPDWFERVLAREAEPLEERPLASEDGVFETRVAAEVLSTPELVDGDYFVQLNLGSPTPMECWIYPEGHDLAGSHRAFSESMFSLIAEAQGEIEMKRIQRIDAGIFGSHPYLALDWLYRVQTAQGLLAGQIKHLAALKGGASVHCIHNESGYGQTFQRVFRGLVDHLEIDGATAPPYYQEILVVLMSDLQLGVARTRMTRDEDGDTRIDEQFSFLLPVDEETLMASDTYNVQFSSPDGRLLNEIAVGAENGELTTELALDPTDDGAWQVSGTFKSKDFESSLEPREAFSILGQMLELREFLADAEAGDQTTFWDWSADADPSAFTEVRVEVQERTDDGVAAHLELGPIKMFAVFDHTGSMLSGRMSMGAIEMELQRVYAQGVLPSP